MRGNEGSFSPIVDPELGYTSVEDANTNCGNMNIAFGYNYRQKPQNPAEEASTIPSEDVYQCQEVLAASLTRQGQDYAVVKLDREVSDREPIELSETVPSAGTKPVVAIGYPKGMPQKISLSVVGDPNELGHIQGFPVYGDILKGNSGGGVFSPKTGRLLGIVTGGDGKSYTVNKQKKCLAPEICGENAQCSRPPFAFDTASLLQELPDSVESRLTTGGAGWTY